MLTQLQAKKDRITGKEERGFTIIEVLIVLVIAGLIMLIVFLAVPALQRNSRNTQRKNEAGRILAGANEWRTNNSNTWPPSCVVGVACPTDAGTIRTQLVGNAGTLNSFNSTSVGILGNTTGNTGVLSATTGIGGAVVNTPSALLIIGQASCTGNNVQPGGGFVVVYAIESGSAWQPVCASS